MELAEAMLKNQFLVLPKQTTFPVLFEAIRVNVPGIVKLLLKHPQNDNKATIVLKTAIEQ